ncbi:efflux RND transporter periplasmic adaptor subunit [Pseudoalteromonas sp. MMG024]|uniref:efflux RND transporter periplasmic adaptor subunit n=1 Tax=Pseudoalteromonas sp. MMG024 TaxID=2909980 RepID=UPI001EFF8CDB|nr:efflux RND transporter periplasmic adaptor subunit [Pseudoalteromonas sp. MMG024]MCF6458370.1 efflux RND transporter periplasmic adaptor subunit [Pseudoalteromonas sp. MMG024]
MPINKTRFPRFVMPVLILILAGIIVSVIFKNPPKAKRFGGAKQAQLIVDAKTIEPRSYRVQVASYGIVKPRTQSVLVAQVSGEISFISDSLRDGGFFEKGQMLLSIDERDYLAEVKIAEASLLSAKQALVEEQARGKQALADWQRLGSGDAPSDLVLRKPQLAAQHANVLSAQAKLEKAQLALERTKIVAPFSGRVLKKHVDIGQVVSNNTQLAEIFATDKVEIRLPINNKDLAFINLPEVYQSGEKTNQNSLVTFNSDLIGEQTWQGTLVRTEGAINDASQQLYVVAQIEDPYSTPVSGQNPVKIGQYVSATIKGREIPNALVIPNNAIYQGSYVYVLDKENQLLRKDISLAWQGESESLVATGLMANERLVVTPLGQVSSGTRVAVIGEAPAKKRDSEQRVTKLKEIAKQRGITVEQLKAERKAMREQEKAL